MSQEAGIKARVQVSGLIECRDKDGQIVKTIEFKGSAPLSENKEQQDGMDNHERNQESGA